MLVQKSVNNKYYPELLLTIFFCFLSRVRARPWPRSRTPWASTLRAACGPTSSPTCPARATPGSTACRALRPPTPTRWGAGGERGAGTARGERRMPTSWRSIRSAVSGQYKKIRIIEVMLSDRTTVSTAIVCRSTGTGGQLTNHAVRYGTRKEIPEMQCCGSGMNIPDHISESLETIFWVKVQYLNFLMRIRNRESRNLGSWIRDEKNSDSGKTSPNPLHCISGISLRVPYLSA